MSSTADMRMPFADLLGIKLTHISPERVEAELVVRHELATIPDILHGGAIMALADNLGGVATVANLPRAPAPPPSKARPISSPPFQSAKPHARMHAAPSRPHHHGLADPDHAQRRQALRAGDSNADRNTGGAELELVLSKPAMSACPRNGHRRATTACLFCARNRRAASRRRNCARRSRIPIP